MKRWGEILLDGLFAMLGMLGGVIGGYLMVHFSFDMLLAPALLDAAELFGAVVGAAVCGIVGANLRAWRQQLLGTARTDASSLLGQVRTGDNQPLPR